MFFSFYFFFSQHFYHPTLLYQKRAAFGNSFSTGWSNLQVALGCSVKVGAEFEPGIEFLGIDFLALGVDVGFGADGEISDVGILSDIQFCLDADVYLFLTIYAQIGSDKLNLKIEDELMNKDHSIFEKSWHFEEIGKVSECTRGNGNYSGYVYRADNNEPINRAKVQIFSNDIEKDLTCTDVHGKFVGINLSAGEYVIRVSAAGYEPY